MPTLEGLQGWPAIIGMLVAGILVGMKIYLGFKKDFRADEGHGVVSSGYAQLIQNLTAENERLAELVSKLHPLQTELMQTKGQVEHLDRIRDELQTKLDEALEQVAYYESLRSGGDAQP